MNGRAIPGVYLFRLYVCDKEIELTTSHRRDPPTRLGWWEITFRLTKISANECDSGTNYLR